jgi:hypothetical protein
VDSNFDEADKDLKKIGKTTESETKRMERGLKSLNKTSVDAFLQRQERAAAAVTATRGRMEGLSVANKRIERRMQAMLNNGIDPQNEGLLKLKNQFIQNTAEIERNSRRQERNNKIKKRAKLAILAMGAALTLLIGKSAQMGNELANIGREAILVNQNFEQFAKNNGRQSLEMMDKLRAATMGFVDDMSLQQQAIQAMASGVAFDDLTTAMEFVSKFALATGKNVTDLMRTTITGLARGSALFLDDIGIMVQGAEDVVGAAVEQMREKMGQFANSSETAAAKAKRLEAEMDTLKQTIGAGLVPAQVTMLETQRELFTLISGKTELVAALALDFAKLAKWVGKTAIGAANFVASLTGADKVAGVMKQIANPATLAIIQREVDALQTLYDTRASDEAIASQQKFIATVAGAQGDYDSFVKALGLESRFIGDINDALDSQAAKLEKANEEKKKLGATAESLKAVDGTTALLEIQAGLYEGAEKSFKARKKREAEYEEGRVKRSIELGEEQAAAEDERNTAILQAFINSEKKKTAALIEQEQLRQQWIQSTFEVAQSVVGMIDGIYAAQSSNRLTEIDAGKQAERDAAKQETADRIAAIQDSDRASKEKTKLIRQIKKDEAKVLADIDRKAAKEKHKQALADWRRSLAMIQVNTALGMAKTWATVGYPAAIPLTIALGAASTAATAVAVANKPVPSAETGGSFMVPENPNGTNRVDSVAVMANGGETVEVTPRGEDSSKSMTVVVKINEQTLWKTTQRGIDSNYITVTSDNIRGS